METTLNITVNEKNWLREFLTSNSTADYAPIAVIALFIIFIIGPTVGYLFPYTIWFGVPALIILVPFLKHKIKHGYGKVDIDELRPKIFNWIRRLATLYYGYEIIGAEHIPKNKPVVLVAFHGTLPMDWSCILSSWSLTFPKQPLPAFVGDKGNLKSRFLIEFCNIFNAFPWTRDALVEKLENGVSILVYPGGAQEVYMSDETYRLQWKNRKGFAHVAKAAKVPIVPLFTKNLQEAFRLPWYVEIIFRKKFVFSHIFSSLFNGFPVKLTTVIGPPIYFDDSITVEELAEKARCALQQLIDEHQRIPGHRLRAMMERFCGSRAKLSMVNRESRDYCVEKESAQQPMIESV